MLISSFSSYYEGFVVSDSPAHNERDCIGPGVLSKGVEAEKVANGTSDAVRSATSGALGNNLLPSELAILNSSEF